MVGRPPSRTAPARRGIRRDGPTGPAPDDGDAFRLPPVPLASGSRLPDPDRRGIRAVDLVITTEDGEQTRLPLVPRHGAWWAPADPLP